MTTQVKRDGYVNTNEAHCNGYVSYLLQGIHGGQVRERQLTHCKGYTFHPKPAGASGIMRNKCQRHVVVTASAPKSKAERREWRRCVVVRAIRIQTILL